MRHGKAPTYMYWPTSGAGVSLGLGLNEFGNSEDRASNHDLKLTTQLMMSHRVMLHCPTMANEASTCDAERFMV